MSTITQFSRNRLLETFHKWHVPKDFADPMYNYLVYGWEPGSCFTSVLANDFYGAVRSSHPANTIEAFKALAGWIKDTMPLESYGSYGAVRNWTVLEEEHRRDRLEASGLIYTAKEETWLALKGAPAPEPQLY